MEAVAATAAPADETRHAESGTRDLAAFRERYEGYVAGVYDFALRATRERSVAEDVVLRTFAAAWEAFPDREFDVYGAARDCAREALRYRERRNGAEREAVDFTRIDAARLGGRAEASFDRGLVELVWDSAAALSLDEFALLASDVRHCSASENGSAQRAARARDAFDERLRNELVVRRARHVCSELELVCVIWQSAEPQRVLAHIRGCARCQASKRGFVSPSAVFGALAPMRPKPELETDRWRGLERATRGRRRRRFGIL